MSKERELSVTSKLRNFAASAAVSASNFIGAPLVDASSSYHTLNQTQTTTQSYPQIHRENPLHLSITRSIGNTDQLGYSQAGLEIQSGVASAFSKKSVPDEAPPELKEVKVPFSFNVSYEKQRAIDSLLTEDETQMELAKDGFKNNARYWAKEYIAGIRTTHYYWEIVEDKGKIRLHHPSFGFADDGTRIALEQDLPDFEKRRRQIEHNVTQRFSDALIGAKKGTLFAWVSMAPEERPNISTKQTMKEIYGGYTMTHLYEVDEVNGQRILKGRDIRNNLTSEQHAEFLESIVGKPVVDKNATSLDILSALVKTKYGTTFSQLETMIKNMDANNVSMSPDDKTEQQMDKILLQQEHQLDVIHALLQQGDIDDSLAVKLFQQWANTVGTLYKTMNKGALFRGPMVQTLMGGSCGVGIGANAGMRKAFGFVPAAISTTLTGNEELLECKCPFCNKQVKAIKRGGLIICPREACGKYVPYNC